MTTNKKQNWTQIIFGNQTRINKKISQKPKCKSVVKVREHGLIFDLYNLFGISALRSNEDLTKI